MPLSNALRKCTVLYAMGVIACGTMSAFAQRWDYAARGTGTNWAPPCWEIRLTGTAYSTTTIKSGVAGLPSRAGSFYHQSSTLLLGQGFGVQLTNDTVPNAVYLLEMTVPTSQTSTDIVLTVSSTNATPSVSQTPAFQAAYSGDTWGAVGYLTNNPGTLHPAAEFYYSGGTNLRSSVDCFRFTQVWPPVSEPMIQAQPKSVITNSGATVSFKVAANGAEPLSYQWQANGTTLIDTERITGAQSASLTVSNVLAQDAGSYQVVITNNYGSATSALASLSLQAAPTIIIQPQSQTAITGTNVTFSSLAASTLPMSYQWQRNGTNLFGGTTHLSGLTSTNLTIRGVSADDEGTYAIVVSNAVGTSTSAGATLTVLAIPTISQQPQSQTVLVGSNITFTIVATGAQPLSYLWYRGAAPIGGATEAAYTLSNVKLEDDNAQFSCLVTNSFGSAQSQTASLHVAPLGPSIVTQPQSQTSPIGSNATFAVVATGIQPLIYQWRLNALDLADNGHITGANTASFAVLNVSSNDMGTYSVTISNAFGMATSDAVGLTVIPLQPTIVLQPKDCTVVTNANATFCAAVSGALPMYYQWLRNGTNLTGGSPHFSGVTATNLTISKVTTNDAGTYSLLASNAFGVTTSSQATLTVFAPVPPSITTQPQDQTVGVGSNATFVVSASGSSPLFYSWRREGMAIAQANDSTYILANAESSDSGAGFVCVVSNVGGSITSRVALLTVTNAPPATNAVQADIYSQIATTTGGGAPYGDYVGSIFASDVQFYTKSGGAWHPFGLQTGDTFGADIHGVLRVSTAGSKTFSMLSDDGSLLFIDGTLVIDNGGPRSPSEATGSVILNVGLHPFEIQFFESFGGPSGVDLNLPDGVSYASAASLRGLVHDAFRGTGVPNALVSIGGYSTASDTSGNYSFANIPPGNYSVTVSKSGYAVYSGEISIPNGAALAQDFTLIPTTQLSNVRASQRSGTKLVDIVYDLSADLPMPIRVAVSTNGGIRYDLPATHFSGAGYGNGVTPGVNKPIVWNAGQDWNSQYSTNMRFMVYSGTNYGESAVTTVDTRGLPVVLLVRGYGPFGPPDSGYWAPMRTFLEADGFEVWDASTFLDGRQSVRWNSAQLRGFIELQLALRSTKPRCMNIIAHSMGGLITRDYLSAGSQLAVGCVIMLSPVNCGSWLANWDFGAVRDPEWMWRYWPPFSALVAPEIKIFSSRLPSTRDLRTSSAMVFNSTHHLLPGKSSGTKYYTIAGTDPGVFFPASTIVQSGIKQNWPPGSKPSNADFINDLAVTKNSSWGIVGAAEAHAFCNGLPLNESVIKNSYGVVGFDVMETANDNHFSIITDESLYINSIRPRLQAATGGVPTKAVLSPVVASRDVESNSDDANVWSMLPNYFGDLSTEGVTNEIQVDSSLEAQFSLWWSTGTVAFTLIAPDGTVISPSSTNTDISYSEQDGGAIYRINNPLAGLWKSTAMVIDAETNTVDYFGSTMLLNQLTFSLDCGGMFFDTNSSVTVTGTIADNGVPISGATINGYILLPDGTTNEIALFDDGNHGDGAAGDGVYGTYFTNTSQLGLYAVNLVASGFRTNGEAFVRVGMGQTTFSAFAPTATLIDSYSDSAIDLIPADGRYEQLVINVAFQVTAPGTYSIGGTLTDTNGTEFASANCEVGVTNAGVKTASLIFNSDAIYASKVVGVFQLRNLILIGTQENAAPLDFRTNAYTTGPYDYHAFSGPPRITVQPQSQRATLGTNVTFTVVVSGTAPLDYQWFKNGMNAVFDSATITGANAAILAINGVSPDDAGDYTLVVTNIFGSATSSVASLSVVGAPENTSQNPYFGTGTNAPPIASLTGWNIDGSNVTSSAQLDSLYGTCAVIGSQSWNSVYQDTGEQFEPVTLYTLTAALKDGGNASGAYLSIEDASSSTNQTLWSVLNGGGCGAYVWLGDGMHTNWQDYSTALDTTTNSRVVGHRMGIRFREEGTNGAAPSVLVANVRLTASPGKGVISEPKGLPNGMFQFRINMWPNAVCEVQCSRDLTNWALLTVLTNQTGLDVFTDMAATNSATYYRFRQISAP